MNAEQNLGLPPDQVEAMEKALVMLKRVWPVAWQHIHFLRHYAFRDNQHPIDMEAYWLA